METKHTYKYNTLSRANIVFQRRNDDLCELYTYEPFKYYTHKPHVQLTQVWKKPEKMQSNHFHESNLISCKLTSWKMFNFVLIVSSFSGFHFCINSFVSGDNTNQETEQSMCIKCVCVCVCWRKRRKSCFGIQNKSAWKIDEKLK